MKAKSKTLYTRSEPSNRPILSCSKRSALRPTILKKIPSACDTLNSAHSTCSSAPASSKPAARPSLVPAANSPACSGQYAARPPSSLSAAATSTDALKTTGQTVRWLEFHSHVVHPYGGALRGVRGHAHRAVFARGHGARDTSGLRRGSFSERCGGRGLRVFAVRIPAASDLVGIYEDVGAGLID